MSSYGWTAPYTTAEPEIKSHQLQDNDDYLIISTDGLFQDMSSQQVATYVGEYINAQQMQQKANKSADMSAGLSNYLVRKALLHAANRLPQAYRTDEATALSSLLQLPVGFRRNLHDDITVVVLKLQNDGSLPADDAVKTAPIASAPTLQRALQDPEREKRLQQQQAAVQRIKDKAKLPARL